MYVFRAGQGFFPKHSCQNFGRIPTVVFRYDSSALPLTLSSDNLYGAICHHVLLKALRGLISHYIKLLHVKSMGCYLMTHVIVLSCFITFGK